MRIGLGFDAHRLVEGRKLIIGGVEIGYHLGLDGHSDADVLAHAVSDAILGALRAGDIGKLFPSDDPAYEGANSIELLREVGELAAGKGYRVADIDSVISAEARIPARAETSMVTRGRIASSRSARMAASSRFTISGRPGSSPLRFVLCGKP